MQFQHFQHMSSQVKQMEDKYIVHVSSLKKKANTNLYKYKQ